MGFVELFDKLINERGSAAILEQRLALLREQAVIVENQVAQLEKEKTGLAASLAQLEAELKTYRNAEQFVEYRGAIFKRKPEGGYAPTPYCNLCHKPMSSAFDEVPYTCRCGGKTPLTPDDLPYALSQLPS